MSSNADKPADTPAGTTAETAPASASSPASASASGSAPAPPPASPAGGGGGSTATHFIFEHKVFSIEGGYFSLTIDRSQVVFNVPLGSTLAGVPLDTLRTTFGIVADSGDDQLLQIVERSLKYVKIIRPGESIPRELLDGSASWSVEDHHRTLARCRMTVQLASWIGGKELVISDRTQLERVAEDPSTQARRANAILELTDRRGMPAATGAVDIERKLDAFTHELSYIEALRERCGKVRSIKDKLVKLQEVYRVDRTIAGELQQMLRLFKTPLEQFDNIFMQIDAQSGEVLSLMKTLDAQMRFVRSMRDDLHGRLLDWDEMIDKWEEAALARKPETGVLMKETYRFLAQRFIQTSVWSRKA